MADWKTRITTLCAIGGIAIGAAACPSNNDNSFTNNGTNGGDVGMEDDTGSEPDMGDDMGEEVTLYYVAQVLSVTEGAEACADVNDPGPDIFGVELQDETGTTLGWGNVVWEEVQFEDNDFALTAHLDGSAPALDGDLCVDFSEDTIVSLGCEAENYIAVEFLDADGNPIALDATATQTIVVHEYGGQCGTGTVVDEYDLNICTDTTAVKEGDATSCDINLIGAGAGASSGEVTGF